MRRLSLGFILPCWLGIGCSQTYLFQRAELVVAQKTPDDQVYGLREADATQRLIPYSQLRLGEDTATALSQGQFHYARLPVRSRGFYHQVAGAIVLGSLVPMGVLFGVAAFDLKTSNNASNLLGPTVLGIMGGVGAITGLALFIRGAVLDYPQASAQP